MASGGTGWLRSCLGLAIALGMTDQEKGALNTQAAPPCILTRRATRLVAVSSAAVDCPALLRHLSGGWNWRPNLVVGDIQTGLNLLRRSWRL